MGTVTSTVHDSLRLPPVAASASRARRFVEQTLAAWGVRDDARRVPLLTTELVTNALLHAGTAIDVCISASAGRVRVEVADSSPRPPDRRRHTADAPTGRGLSLVEAEALAWGVRPRDGGKAVWFEVAVPGWEAAGNGSSPRG